MTTQPNQEPAANKWSMSDTIIVIAFLGALAFISWLVYHIWLWLIYVWETLNHRINAWKDQTARQWDNVTQRSFHQFWVQIEHNPQYVDFRVWLEHNAPLFWAWVGHNANQIEAISGVIVVLLYALIFYHGPRRKDHKVCKCEKSCD